MIDTEVVQQLKEDLRETIEEILQEMRIACGGNKRVYLQEAYEVISDVHIELEEGLGYVDHEQFTSCYDLLKQRDIRTFDPDGCYEDGEDEEEDWDDFEEEGI